MLLKMFLNLKLKLMNKKIAFLNAASIRIKILSSFAKLKNYFCASHVSLAMTIIENKQKDVRNQLYLNILNLYCKTLKNKNKVFKNVNHFQKLYSKKKMFLCLNNCKKYLLIQAKVLFKKFKMNIFYQKSKNMILDHSWKQIQKF